MRTPACGRHFCRTHGGQSPTGACARGWGCRLRGHTPRPLKPPGTWTEAPPRLSHKGRDARFSSYFACMANIIFILVSICSVLLSSPLTSPHLKHYLKPQPGAAGAAKGLARGAGSQAAAGGRPGSHRPGEGETGRYFPLSGFHSWLCGVSQPEI